MNSGSSRSSEQLQMWMSEWLSRKSTGQINTYGHSGLGSNPVVGIMECKTKTRGFTNIFYYLKKKFLSSLTASGTRNPAV